MTRIKCLSCELEVSSHFSTCKFCTLSATDLQFMETFIKARGNVKEMERELEISYWSIRSQLNELIEKLGFESEPDHEAEALQQERYAILEQVDRGELDASRAAEMLAKLK